MESNLSPEDRAFWEEVLSKAEPFPEYDSNLDINDERGSGFYSFDRERNARMLSTLAKMILEGRLK